MQTNTPHGAAPWERRRFRRMPRDRGAAGGQGLAKLLTPRAKSIDREQLTVRFVLSTEACDREGDRIAAEGWELEHYRDNPVVLWAHDPSLPPVARAEEVAVEAGALVAKARFTPAETNPFGHMTFRLYAEGFLNAVSVGFRPLEWRLAEEEARRGGLDFLRQELVEFSCVPVPANPEALVRARGLGIDTRPLALWTEALLDGSHLPPAPGAGTLSRRALEKLRRAALGGRSRRGTAALSRPYPASDLGTAVKESLDRALTLLTGRLPR